MEILLYISAVYLAYTIVVLTRNLWEFKSLANQPDFNSTGNKAPLVSICIPARNEEDNIERCVTSALKQDYPNFEVLVLDDNSTDRTPEILNKLSGIINNLYHLSGKPKPDDWLGKPWACQQLSEQANGEYLVFIDADVWLEEKAITKAINVLQKSDVITVWPKQILHSFWEKMIVPIVYFGLYTLLPAKYVEHSPKWLPGKLRGKLTPKFAAACGQFIAFNRKAYVELGGHASVKHKIVEDVELAKIIKQQDLTLTMFDGVGTVNCRMYTSHREIFEGLRKNFFAGFGQNTLLFISMAALQFIVYIIPVFVLFSGHQELKLFAAVIFGIMVIQRWILDLKFSWNPAISILHPISILWFEILGIRCLLDHYTGTKARWKGREV